MALRRPFVVVVVAATFAACGGIVANEDLEHAVQEPAVLDGISTEGDLDEGSPADDTGPANDADSSKPTSYPDVRFAENPPAPDFGVTEVTGNDADASKPPPSFPDVSFAENPPGFDMGVADADATEGDRDASETPDTAAAPYDSYPDNPPAPDTWRPD